jgi:subtilase family serine protease
VESEPSYQSNYGLQYSNGSFNARTTPDVSFDADFYNSPVLFYDGGFDSVGGTSFSAPAWAALIAIADEARAADNESSLDGPTQTLPDLYKLPSNDYHDITQGNDGYPAGVGYDFVTGLGTPVASRVVGDLWGQSPPKANNDSYAVSANTTLNVSASNGVLVNDTDPMGEPLIVSTFAQPANGSVTVYQDGSFTYTPNKNFSGTDSFTYTILDTGTGVGSTATVQITVSQTLGDLAPYTPSGWSGPLVVSTQSGDRTTATTITTADTVYIDWAFINQGSAPITTAFQSELLLDGKKVNTWSTGAPLNQGTYISITDYSLGQLAPGSHTVTLTVDYLNQVPESDKNNDTTSYTFTVTQAGLPDLAPYTPSGWSGPLVVSTQSGNRTTASSIADTDTVYVDWAFINQGSVAINNAFGVELLLDGTQVKTWSAGVPLNPNTYTYVTDYSLGQLAAGTHTVTVVADYQNTVTESNEANNTSTYTFTVTQPELPDLAPYTPLAWSGPLVVSTLSGSTTTATTISTTNDVYIDWAFINRGNAAINTAYQFELLLDGTAVQTWSGPVPLNPSFYTYINDYSLGQLAAGSHTVTVIADDLNQVTESDKSNNTETYTFSVTQTALPDLAPYTPSGWSGPLVVSTQAGDTSTAFTITTADSVYIDWAFINQGSVAINNAFGVELLLDGTQVHTWPAGVPLNPNFYTYITGYSLGQLAAGSHTVTVVADYLNQVTESNKNNNSISDTFTVTQPALPDLAPYTPSGWSGPLVVSTQSGNTTTASSITTANNIYIDWAFINQGNATITTTFHTELLVDGVPVHTWVTNPPLGPTIYTFVQNFSLGRLAAGSHSVTVVADYLDETTESGKNNNTTTDTFTVSQPLSAGQIQFSAPTYSADITSGSAQVVLTRAGNLSATVSVVVSSPGGPDVAPFQRTITFGPNVQSATVTIPIQNDGQPGESDVSIPLSLSSPGPGASLGTTTSATLVVHDNNPFPTPVIVTSLQLPTIKVKTGTGKKAKTKTETVVQLHLSGPLNGAGNLGAYKLLSGQTKRGVTTFKTVVPLASVVYSSTALTVTLIPAGKLNLSKPEQLRITAALLTDTYGRPLDGNYDGQPGGNFVATFKNRGITFAQVKSAARIEALSASAVDAVFDAGLISSVPPARGRLHGIETGAVRKPR